MTVGAEVGEGGGARNRILIVEDESIVALDLRTSLERLGYEVVGTVATGEDALRIARARTPDLVLMDIQLRGEPDGTAVADVMRRELQLPIVFLTAYSDDATLARAQISEPFGYLLKPFDQRELQVTLQLALYRHRAQREHEELLREQAARTALEAEQRWAKFLADATATITTSLDVHQTQESFVRVLVPAIADWAAVHVKGAEPETVAVAQAGGKPSAEWESLRRHDFAFGSRSVLQTGQAELVATVTPEILRAVAVDVEHFRLLAEVGITSWLCLPLPIRGETYGTITLAMVGSGRRFTPADVDRLMELARRCGTAVENARLYQVAQDAIALREEFLSIAAHELRTPIAAVLLALFGLQRLAAEPGRETIAKKVALIIQQFDRLSALVDQLLDVSRIRTGKLDLHVEDFDLAKVVREVTERFQDAAARVGCALRVETPRSLPGAWDLLRIEQVLTNLIANAIKFCANQPIEVLLAERGDGVVLTVRDHGVGIPQDRIPFIFERFERGVSVRHYGGLGLGLYVTRQIVEAHGGAVAVESDVGRGSVFTVRLPRRAAGGHSTALPAVADARAESAF